TARIWPRRAGGKMQRLQRAFRIAASRFDTGAHEVQSAGGSLGDRSRGDRLGSDCRRSAGGTGAMVTGSVSQPLAFHWNCFGAQNNGSKLTVTIWFYMFDHLEAVYR